jgi:tetratricopeptide (TPR) repeat protein
VAEKPDDPQINYQCAWVHDLLGLEHEAVPFYERAIEEGLTGEDLEGAMLGLGSTYRALGEYQRAVEALRGGTTRFPNNRAMQVFLAMALYNAGECREAVELLLRNLAETTGDEGISAYNRAILFYAGRLDDTWR